METGGLAPPRKGVLTMLKINGTQTNAEQFFFDGCHKIYLLEGSAQEQEEQKQRFYKRGWNENDLLHIENLHDVWKESCPFRFIQSAKEGHETFIPQCFQEPVTFEYDGTKVTVEF